MNNNKNSGIEELAKQFDLDRTDPIVNGFLIALKTREMEKDEEYRRLENRVIYDGKTGLERVENLFPFLEREYARAERHNEDVSILMIDADNFKLYNDNYGHVQGDEALKTIAQIVRESTRKEDIAVRYGGEEICIVLPETDQKELRKVAEKIRSRIERTQIPESVKGKNPKEGGYKSITVSIGGFTYNSGLDAVLGFLDSDMGDEDKIKVLIEEADKALYQAKESGRNRYCVAEM